MEEYWLFTIMSSEGSLSNCFFNYFPSKSDLIRSAGTGKYGIINVTRLTKEQYKKLTE